MGGIVLSTSARTAIALLSLTLAAQVFHVIWKIRYLTQCQY